VLVLVVVQLAGADEFVGKEQPPLRLVTRAGTGAPEWMAREDVWALQAKGERLFDLTAHPDAVDRYVHAHPSPAAPTTPDRLLRFPSEPQHEDVVIPLAAEISSQNYFNYLDRLSSFHNRFYLSPTGVESVEWIHDMMVGFGGARVGQDIAVDFFHHEDYDQPSVIARILGTDEPDQIVLVCAHEDSVNWMDEDPITDVAPGADDNGSGTVAVMEIFRVLAQSYRPKVTMEFHLYAAEEVGLLGAIDVAESYRGEGKNVVGVYNLDMIAYAGLDGNNTFVMQVVSYFVSLFVHPRRDPIIISDELFSQPSLFFFIYLFMYFFVKLDSFKTTRIRN